jgi:hypothetical protein
LHWAEQLMQVDFNLDDWPISREQIVFRLDSLMIYPPTVWREFQQAAANE